MSLDRWSILAHQMVQLFHRIALKIVKVEELRRLTKVGGASKLKIGAIFVDSIVTRNGEF